MFLMHSLHFSAAKEDFSSSFSSFLLAINSNVWKALLLVRTKGSNLWALPLVATDLRHWERCSILINYEQAVDKCCSSSNSSKHKVKMKTPVQIQITVRRASLSMWGQPQNMCGWPEKVWFWTQLVWPHRRLTSFRAKLASGKPSLHLFQPKLFWIDFSQN